MSASESAVTVAADTGVVAENVARAVARAVYEATALPFPGALPSWREKFAASAR